MPDHTAAAAATTHVEVTGQQLEDLHRDRDARDQHSVGAAEPDLGGRAAVGPTQGHQREADDQEAGDQHEVLGVNASKRSVTSTAVGAMVAIFCWSSGERQRAGSRRRPRGCGCQD